MRICLFLLSCWTAASVGEAATLQEDFASGPAAHGWLVFGNTSLFRWNPSNENLEVTWDSSQTNSYFHRPLGTVLTRSDDFGLAFDLRPSDIAVGVNPNKRSTFELAVGFLNFTDAASTNFERGIGVNSSYGPRNLAEFDYFPDSGLGATISPTMISSNNQFAAGFDFPLELTGGDLFHIAMTYTASNQTFATSITRNGQPFRPIKDVKLGAGFTDFRLDAIAVNSYSDAGADGSILARGVVDNFVVAVPDPPVANLTGVLADGVWRVQFTGRSAWVYTLERTEEFQSWASVSSVAPIVDGDWSLSDTNMPGLKALYRVRADRP